MKKLFLLFFIFSSYLSFSQYGIKIIHVRPTGRLGNIVKPTITGEFLFKGFDDEDFIPRFGIGFIKFSTRLDTFPVQGIISSNSTTIVPGTLTYHKFNFVYVYGGLEYKIKLHKKINLNPGLDINVGSKMVSYEAYYPLISSEGYSGGSVYVGIRPRICLDYFINEHAVIFIEAVRNMNLIPQEAFMAYNDYGIGFRYNFKK